MISRALFITGVLSIIVAVVILELSRRKRLREEYSLLWLIVSLAIAVLALWQDLLIWLTNVVGAGTAESTIILVMLFFFIAVNIHLTARVSTLTKTVTTLVQELALSEASSRKRSNDRE